MKSFVSVMGWGPPESITIKAGTPSLDLLRFPAGVNDSGLSNLTLENVTTAGKFAVVNESGNRRIYCRDLRFKTVKGGILTKSAGSFTLVWDCEAVSVVDYPFRVDAGADTEMRIFTSTVRPSAAAIIAYHANGGCLHLLSCHAEDATTGVKVEGGCHAIINGSHFEDCVTGFHVTGSGSILHDHGAVVEDRSSTPADIGLLVENGATALLMSTHFIRYDTSMKMGSGGNNSIITTGVTNGVSTTYDLLAIANVGFQNTFTNIGTSLDPAKVSVDTATFTIVDPLRARPDFIGPAETGVYNLTTLTAADLIRYTKVNVTLFVEITGVTLISQAARNVSVGIYRNSTNARIAQSVVTAIGTGMISVPFTAPVFLVPGVYWLAYVHNSPALVASLSTDAGFNEAQTETGPGATLLPATKTGTAVATKMLLLGPTQA